MSHSSFVNPNPTELPDSELVAMMQSADPKKVERGYKYIMDTYVPLLLRYAYSRGITGADAEDAIAEMLVSLPRYIRSFKSSSSLRSYLFAVFRHRLVDYWRRTSQIRENITNSDLDATNELGGLARRIDLASPDTLLSESEDTRELQRLLLKAFERLTPQDTLLLRMRVIEGASFDTVAEALGISRGTVASRLQRTMQTLRREITALGGAELGERAASINLGPLNVKEHE